MSSIAKAEYETIAAIATPPGRGAIGIVRLSGPEAQRVALALVRLQSPLEERRPRLVKVRHPERPDDLIDDALLTWFPAARSYTGEDVVEIAAHGSPVVLEAILLGALKHGARLARPGEFTERAFLAGRLDLTEAEAVHDLIASQTLEQARTAASQLGGAISRRVAPAKESLLQLIALLEAGMDFASGELDDVDVVPTAAIDAALHAVLVPLNELSGSFRGGQLLRSGAALALVGRPNAGKSSLFNRLLRRERAIVTPLPGTTRDTVEETLSLGGIPIRLVDTAGLRVAGEAPADAAEAQGIARSREALADADVVLLVFDGSMAVVEEELAVARSLAGRPHVLVWNKVDLRNGHGALPAEKSSGAEDRPEAEKLPGAEDLPGAENLLRSVGGRNAVVATSATTGEGIEALREAILHELNAPGALSTGGALNTLRQHDAVTAAAEHLQQALEANSAGMPHEALLLDLHAARQALDELTGETTTEDILGRIFSSFCIGK